MNYIIRRNKLELLIAMAPQGGNGGGNMMSTVIMFGAIFVIFYFMIIRPQQKKAKERQKMLDAIEKGNKVVTSGGIHGVIDGLDDKTVLLDVGNKVKMKFERSAISQVIK